MFVTSTPAGGGMTKGPSVMRDILTAPPITMPTIMARMFLIIVMVEPPRSLDGKMSNSERMG